MIYDNSCEKSIFSHAQKLQGKTIDDILKLSNLSKKKPKDKGAIGTIIEEAWFGIKQNSSPLPDFDKVGIELKIIPLIENKKRLSVKERTKICSINYNTLIDEKWENSHAKTKLNKILFVYYLYNKENKTDSKIQKVVLWELQDNHSEMIIKNDWYNVQKKVFEGLAHKLSEKDSEILSPSRSGQGGIKSDGTQKDLVSQPNKRYQEDALKRAFSLKRSFTDQYWLEISQKNRFESIIDSLNITDFNNFEKMILTKLYSLSGQSIEELSLKFNIKISKSKNKVATIVKKAIGFKNVNSKIKEFEQLGISIKIINARKKDNYPCEAISFPTLTLNEFIKEDWEESTLNQYLHKILFIPVYKEHCKIRELDKHIIGKSFFWMMSDAEEKIINHEWKNYQQEIKNGKCKVEKIQNNTKRGYKEITNLSKESDTKIIHMRPHGKNADDRDIDIFGNSLIKQSFWLNKKFIQNLLKDISE